MKRQIKYFLLMLLFIALAAAVCAVLGHFTGDDAYAGMIFLLSTALIVVHTKGIGWGIAASLVSTLLVNFVFTKPYLEFTAGPAGYPVTFAITLAVSLLISMLTSQLKKQSELNAAAEREKLRTELMRALAHDMRTPLTSISGDSSVWLESHEALPEAVQVKLISDIKKQADWLAMTFENILTITRVDSADAKINKRPEAAEEVIAEVSMAFRQKHPEISVTSHIPDELLMVPMDVLLIKQVFINLMENALLHGGGIHEIIISLCSRDNMAVFAVRDDGNGISPDILPKLFSGLFMNKENDKDSRTGMGIGLSLCRSVVMLHGGQINGYNGDSGAVFEFSLPLEYGGK